MTAARQSIFYIDFLRFIAAIAVIMIHVLGPFRYLYGEIPGSDWLAAAGLNSLTRWAVPVFMMISGALLLSSKTLSSKALSPKPLSPPKLPSKSLSQDASSQESFKWGPYLIKRVSKVVVPFVGWTIIFALVSGYMVDGIFTGEWSSNIATETLGSSLTEPVWYHLWFFYDFIPLYFVIPFLLPLLKQASDDHIKLALSCWAILLFMHWLKIGDFLQQNLVLYSGYLVLGWYLFNRDNRDHLKYWITAGSLMLLLNFFGTWYVATEKQAYSSLFMGYKTINTAIIGGMLFVLAQTYAHKIQGRLRALVTLISTYSLGIYLVHPLVLIPIRDLNSGFYQVFQSNWIAIPMLTFLTLAASLLLTMLLVKLPFIRRLVP
ncbi:acyltransferase [Psychromonas arctica]|uniref:acyltransferase n=1 Tax=Psychromonas arctica TaxID=168275 RepID=UPI00042A7EB9|nr:acyltransferase [Psychromonas arctica]